MINWKAIIRFFTRRESGVTFMETVIALAILGTVSVTFLNGLTTTSKSVFMTDERSTAESIAQTQMEWVKNASYDPGATTYPPAPIPDGKDYLNYSTVITAAPLDTPDDGIQKVTVTIQHSSKDAFHLEGYKVDR
jgi:type II secretory pathway pseudopilin PulG